MSISRDMILAAVRANAPAPSMPLPPVPTFDRAAAPLLDCFRAGFELLGGTFVETAPDADLNAKFAELFPPARFICSTVAEVTGTKRLQDITVSCRPSSG